MTEPRVLPPHLVMLLETIGRRLKRGESVASDLPAAIDAISALPATTISQAAREIADTAGLFRSRPPPSVFETLVLGRVSEKGQLLRLPQLSYLFLFHHDGWMREAALRRISGGLPSPFLLAAIAFRLNDWVEPVRAAALSCAERSFPATAPEVIAGAATALLLRRESWGRWGKEREAIDSAFARPDVAASLADLLIEARTGPATPTLSAALRHDTLDAHLGRLAGSAMQPSVRALAVRTIADGRATWPSGFAWKWIDKSLGRRTRVLTFASREINQPLAKSVIVRAAVSDASAVVRRAALDALIRHRLGSPEAHVFALGLSADSSRSVRERAAFILSRGA